MYFALRDLRTAQGRFALIAGVVLLLSVLVAGLLGLTAGLAHQSVSALRALGSGDSSFVLPADENGAVDLDRAAFTEGQLNDVTAADPSAVPVGVARIRVDDGSETGVSAVAVGLGGSVGSLTPPPPGEVLASTGVGDEVGAGATELRVDSSALRVTGGVGDLWHSHTPVVVTDLATWHELAPRGGAATTVAVSSAESVSHAGLTVVDPDGLVSSLPSHRAENTSLNTMTFMLLAVTALVVGAFFAVWGMQRRRDVAVIKALGGSTTAVVRDAVGQAAIVLAVGIGGGVGIAALFGVVARGAVPYVVSPATTVLPAVLLAVLGLAGAAVSLRPVVAADPATALGSLR
ncbi:ABC transporter substrate-binding protein [Dietzia sp. UCD-THP]|uniref:FtsX-like permease family protein n=1 Tax=Dietzia sp. UCD-THP TaxID=1292020 RepID=UPI000377DFA2|nr:ABC transporter permease [Dietzia sp. UCD-THP]EYT57979.1 ABC transporter substrate-binding protein [Dietzia sp. UCD-THP]